MRESTETRLRLARQLLRRGRLKEAESVCREVLHARPRDPDATHLLGLARKDSGDVISGERFIRASIALQPQRAEFRSNLANLLSREGRAKEAIQAYREALQLHPAHKPALRGLARALSGIGEYGAAESACRKLIASDSHDAEAWLVLGSVLRARNLPADAESAYRRAIASRPGFAAAHHNLGALLSELERAEEALVELDRARALGLETRESLINRGRTLVELCRLDEAEACYAKAVSLEPRDVRAQRNLAELRYMQGDPEFARALQEAASVHAQDLALHLQLCDVLRAAGNLSGAERTLRDVMSQVGAAPEARAALALVLHEAGQLREAETEAQEAADLRPGNERIVEHLVAIKLALGKHEEAAPLISAQRARRPDEQRWIAYEATAARLAGDPRYRELYAYDDLVRVYELEPPEGWSSMSELIDAAVESLVRRHPFVSHPLGQSLRNGSQAARGLLTDPDPSVQALLQTFRAPIEDYRAHVGQRADHPLTARNHGPVQVQGCWSVRLHSGGFHVNHVHPQGWISSACYLSVPDEAQDADRKAGWLKFGEVRYPAPGAGPERFVQPRPGRLVLFPSYMWHGTNPIIGPGPRVTVAFDAAPALRAHSAAASQARF